MEKLVEPEKLVKAPKPVRGAVQIEILAEPPKPTVLKAPLTIAPEVAPFPKEDVSSVNSSSSSLTSTPTASPATPRSILKKTAKKGLKVKFVGLPGEEPVPALEESASSNSSNSSYSNYGVGKKQDERQNCVYCKKSFAGNAIQKHTQFCTAAPPVYNDVRFFLGGVTEVD